MTDRRTATITLSALAKRLLAMAASESKVGLKVGMYPYIPDLNRDNLKSLQEMIKNDFEKKNPDVQLTIVTNWDPYDVDNKSKQRIRFFRYP